MKIHPHYATLAFAIFVTACNGNEKTQTKLNLDPNAGSSTVGTTPSTDVTPPQNVVTGDVIVVDGPVVSKNGVSGMELFMSLNEAKKVDISQFSTPAILDCVVNELNRAILKKEMSFEFFESIHFGNTTNSYGSSIIGINADEGFPRKDGKEVATQTIAELMTLPAINIKMREEIQAQADRFLAASGAKKMNIEWADTQGETLKNLINGLEGLKARGEADFTDLEISISNHNRFFDFGKISGKHLNLNGRPAETNFKYMNEFNGDPLRFTEIYKTLFQL